MTVKITTLREAAQQALAAMDYMLNNGEWYQAQERADALRAALAEPVQEPVAWIHKETGLLRREISRPKGADWDSTYWEPRGWDSTYWEPLYASPAPTAEDIAQDWDLLQETQSALRDAWAILKKLKTVQDAARNLVESDPDSAADTEGDAFTAWCALVDAIDDADTLLCEFGESHE